MTSDTVWDHFVIAVAPAIQKWQLDVSDKPGSYDLGQLLTKSVEKVQNSDEQISEILILL